MKETPAYEQYPVSEEEMGKRYKNWTSFLARQLVVFYRIGEEVGGQKFIDRLKEEFHEDGKKGAIKFMRLSGTTKDDFKDCTNYPLVQDILDDQMANFWDGYVENSPEAFEKELKTCPVAKEWSKAPELCEILLAESLDGMAREINPDFRSCGFSKTLASGDDVCRFRVELSKPSE